MEEEQESVPRSTYVEEQIERAAGKRALLKLKKILNLEKDFKENNLRNVFI